MRELAKGFARLRLSGQGLLPAFAATVMTLGMSLSNGVLAQGNKPFPDISLPAPANGNAAVNALGSNLPALAAHYGYTTDQLARALREDLTLWIDRKGRLYYVEAEAPESVLPDGSDDILDPAPYPLGETFSLNSKPGAPRTIFLDFDGHVTEGTAWNSSYSITTINSPPYDTNGNPGVFSDGELSAIQRMWRMVAEDFAPFDVNVTTQDPGIAAITRSGSGDGVYGTRVVITDDFVPNGCGCGGFAYVGIFNRTDDFYKPAFVFNTGRKGGGEAITHEAGHNLGLSHDGTSSVGYYTGHGSGETGWAPIMGVGYNKSLVQWSRGEYADANQTQDDYTRMQQYGLPVRSDDHGDSIAGASDLNAASDGITTNLSGRGVIAGRNDADFFRFFSGSGSFDLSATPSPDEPNLDLVMRLHNADGSVIASSNPTEQLAASLSGSLGAGEYYVSVDGVGKGDVLGTGYSDYGSLGNYSVSGVVADASGLQPPQAVASAQPATGVVAAADGLLVNFDASASADADTYAWDLGDGNSATGVAPSHYYYEPGSYTVQLTVTNTESGLSGTDSLVVTVENRAPTAVIGPVADNLQAPQTVEFDGSASTDPDSIPQNTHGIVSHAWDFGDGGTGAGVAPSHTYETGGTFSVSLTVTDSNGATDTAQASLVVAPPAEVDVFANSQLTNSGTVFGGLAATRAVDGETQQIREVESGGKPQRRHSLLEHRWYLDVPGGDSALLSVTARQTDSGEGDPMTLYYQIGSGPEQAFAALTTSDNNYLAVLPQTGVSLTVIARDGNRDQGTRSLDSIFVDQLVVTVTTDGGGEPPEPPVAPDAPALSVSGTTNASVDLSWTYSGSEVTGFRVFQSADCSGGSTDYGSNARSGSVTGLSAETSYAFSVQSFNTAGSACSNAVTATTDPASALTLQASGRKTKGQKIVDLTWTGADTVEVYRDGTVIGAGSNGSYTDSGLGKGGGSYTYFVCDASSACSDPVTVVF